MRHFGAAFRLLLLLVGGGFFPHHDNVNVPCSYTLAGKRGSAVLVLCMMRPFQQALLSFDKLLPFLSLL